MNKIRILMPYFGRLPETFPFWYHSALNNPDVDFLFITDCDVEARGNIAVIKTTFEEERLRYEQVLGMKLCLAKPYRICDYRPVFGLLYAEQVKGYDFWGFGDIDLVYGRIRDFITEDVLNSHDMISCWGHLSMYRNCEFMNNLFKEKHEGYLYYEDVFSHDEHKAFDELWNRGVSSFMVDFRPDRVFRCENLFDDIIIPTFLEHFKDCHTDDRNCLTFKYENKNLYRIYFDPEYRRHVEPTMYVHLQKRREWKIDIDDYSSYVIYPNSFHRPFRFLQDLKLTWLGRSRRAHLI